MNRAIVFFPVNPWPPSAGNHQRALQIIGGLQSLGMHVTLASTRLDSAPVWDESSAAALLGKDVDQLAIHTPSQFDRRFVQWYDRFSRRSGHQSAIDQWRHSPPGMRKWFHRLVEAQNPDLILINYARWGGLVSHNRYAGIRRIIDMIDLESVNAKMWHWLSSRLPVPPIDAAKVSPDVLREDCFHGRAFQPESAEFKVYDQFDVTMAISEREADLVALHTHHTRVGYLPMTASPVAMNNTYDGPAVFATGPNPFNLQGYLYFVNKVLPRLALESDFQLMVTGYVSSQVLPTSGVRLEGFLPHLSDIYRTARFAICPLIGGTGQPVKIVEAMAHGLAVVALDNVADRSPIVHGVNGLIAADATEFAEHTRSLWSDRARCRRLGAAARETVAASLSHEKLVSTLSQYIK